ncbi:MAG: ATP-binding protein [Lachnospiraceae bacterium]
MKFRTRLIVTFSTIVLLPLALTIIAFLCIGVVLMNNAEPEGMGSIDYKEISDSAEVVGEQTQILYEKLVEIKQKDAYVFEDMEYLKNLNDSINRKNSYILVRKNDSIYYTGNEKAAKVIFSRLPGYGENDGSVESVNYYHDLNKYTKQLDFEFRDGSPGSLFIITRVNNLISGTLLKDMFFAMFAILVFTSFLLTRWIHRGVFNPIKELNTAMTKIKDGDFDYRLTTDNNSNDEIGQLYRNYEDMRLRLKENLEEQEQQDKQNRVLISNISHDLKTPITAIKGYMEGIMDGVADTPEKMDKYIKTVYNKANDMDRLINELTIYSSIDNNRIPYNFHRINVADYFGDCVEEVGMDLESKNIKLNYSNMVSEDTQIIADPEQLKRVINNIIGNSVKYRDKDDSYIDIRILDEPDAIRVEIEDNGKGIEAKDLSRIFERFYRADTSRNSAQGGSGIGLSIVKKIIEDHGGYIWATSKEGEGTCMHFVIRKYKEVV